MKTRMVTSHLTDGISFTKEYKTQKDMPPDITLHWHDCFEFDIIRQGAGTMIANGVGYTVSRGMIGFMSPMDFHEYRHCDQLSLINIQFKADGINAELINQFLLQHTCVVYVEEEAFGRVEALCDLLGSLPNNSRTMEYDTRLLECLILTFLDGCRQPTAPYFRSDNIHRAVTYVNAHFRENPAMAEVARLFSYSPAYFCRLFRDNVGMGYKEYIRELKLNYGMKLVRYTNLSVTEIAFNCGYETQTHFNREFKAKYHAAPSSFRKQ